MKRFGWIVLGTLAAVVLGAVVRPAWMLEAESPSLGYVDMERLVNEFDKNSKLTEQLKTELGAVMQRLEENKKKIQLQKEELALFTKGSAKYEQALHEIRRAEAMFEADQDWEFRQIENRRVLGWKELYGDIKKAVAEVAEAKGLEAVFVMNGSLPDGKNNDEIVAQIMLRQVAYMHPSFDLTVDVLRVLNRS